MMEHLPKLHILRSQRGVAAVIVGIAALMLIGFAALAVDLGHLFGVRNELQNAADAGALAGAKELYNDDGTVINESANQIGHDTAEANSSEGNPVEVNWTSGNEGDVQRGHWSFATRTFSENPSTEVLDLWDVSFDDLDANPAFINAVRVVARREATPVASFFARIFGHEDFQLAAEATAYLGFAGTLNPFDVDQPIAICKQSIMDEEGNYSCNIGRMLNSGSSAASHNTAGWTNFIQPCETADTTSIRQILEDCATGNPDPITLGDGIGTTGGVVQSIFEHPTGPDIMDCWKTALYDSDGDGEKDSPIDTDGDGWPDQPLNLTLPVIDCQDNNVGPCSEVKGAVNLNIVWIVEKDNKIDDDAPRKMGSWENNDPSGQVRWNDFISPDNFNLQNVDGEPAPFAKKSVYFLPDCTPHVPTGVTGGDNYGILADVPVLVK